MNKAPAQPGRHGCIAWLVGSFLYMFLALEVIADAGFMAIPFQAIMGVVFSIILIGVAYLLGFVLRIPILSRIWYSSALVPIVIIVLAIIVLLFGQGMGMTTTFQLPDSDEPHQTLHPLAGFGAWFAAIFAALHFSTGRLPRHASNTNT